MLPPGRISAADPLLRTPPPSLFHWGAKPRFRPEGSLPRSPFVGRQHRPEEHVRPSPASQVSPSELYRVPVLFIYFPSVSHSCASSRPTWPVAFLSLSSLGPGDIHLRPLRASSAEVYWGLGGGSWWWRQGDSDGYQVGAREKTYHKGPRNEPGRPK